MSYHDILVKVGDFGLYQKLLCGIFVFYTTFLCGLNFYTQVFIFNTPAHRCSDDVIDSEQGRAGASWEEVLPWVPRETGYPSSCHMLDASAIKAKFRNLSSTYFSSLKMQETDPDQFTAIRHNVISLVEGSPHKLCDQGWNFDHRNVFNTITSENNWVCEDDYKPMLIHTIFWIGNTVGCLLWGFTNDFFGRKPTVLLTHTVYVLAGAATLMAPNFTALLICRFLVGCAHHTVSHLPYLIVVEYCGVSSRTVPLLMVMMSYTLASLTLPWVAMLMPSWRLLSLTAALAILPILAGWKLIPESPSWLLVKGRTKEALDQLERVARFNKADLQENEIARELEKEKQIDSDNPVAKATLLQMFKTENLRLNAFLCTVICMMGFMCYYGHVQNTSNLGEGNVYKSYFLGALVEIPCWSVPFIIAKMGRRWPLLFLFTCSGICGVVYGFIPDDLPRVSLTVGLIGRMTVNGAYFICLQYSSEIFPTVIRGQGIALCEIVGGIAIFLSPMVVYLAKFSPILPLLILGLCSLLGALATFFLPETAGQELPQTLKDGQEFGQGQGRWDCVCIKQRGQRFSKTAERVELDEEVKEVILPRVLTNATLPRVLTNLSIAQVIQ